MKYQVCYTSEYLKKDPENIPGYPFGYYHFANRDDCLDWITDNKQIIDGFSVPETGLIFGWAIELDGQDIPNAILYNHDTLGLIWIEINECRLI